MKRISKYLPPIIFGLALVIIGLLIYRDYGIPWDEAQQIQIGTLNHRYAFKGDTQLLTFPDRYYGAFFEVLLLWLTARLSIARHLLIFLIFVGGLLIFYFLSRRVLGSWWALLATGMLVISPRIFGDAFYNSKDILFMVASIAAIWTLILLADSLKRDRTPLYKAAMIGLHAFASAVLIGTRVPGVVILPLSVFLILIGIVETPSSWKERLAALGGYLILTAGLTVLVWPILWHDPWGQFINAFQAMSRYSFNRPVLYMGQFYSPAHLPWHYLPVWIAITTPLVVLIGFIPGIADWIRGFWPLRKQGENNPGQNQAHPEMDPDRWTWSVLVGWIAIPVAAVYWFHSVLYDGWRQMFFIYPALVLISARGLKAVFTWVSQWRPAASWLRFMAGLLLLAGLAEPVWFMIRYHPHQNVYFNSLAGDPATLRQRFELDYWGLSYKQAIDFILANDSRPAIKIAVANPPGMDYINFGLPADQKSRLVPVDDPAEADYFATEFRWHPEDYPYSEESYSISVRGTKIMAVYRIP